MTVATARIARSFPTFARAHFAYRLHADAACVGAPRTRIGPVQVRKLKYHVNVSVDGFILSKGEGFNAFAAQDDSTQYLESLHAYGIALMGRHTYDAALEAGIADPYPHLMSYVFSRSPRVDVDPRVEWVTQEAADWVRRLKTCPGKDIYLCGGAHLATSLFKAGLIDEMILKVSPVLLGSGQRLLSELDGRISLLRESSVAYDDGTVMLTYRVQAGKAMVAA